MAESKQDLVERAEELGVEGAKDMNKAELAEALEQRQSSASGPYVPEGEINPLPPESTGEPVVGIEPRTADEIPESAR